jgi:hypothetical protein
MGEVPESTKWSWNVAERMGDGMALVMHLSREVRVWRAFESVLGRPSIREDVNILHLMLHAREAH